MRFPNLNKFFSVNTFRFHLNDVIMQENERKYSLVFAAMIYRNMQ